MKCPVCGVDTRTLTTKEDRRRRECFNGHRFNTVEVPVEDRKERAQIRRANYLKAMAKVREQEIAEHEAIRAATGTLAEIATKFERSISYVWTIRRGDKP